MACAVQEKEEIEESVAIKKMKRLENWLGRIQKELGELREMSFKEPEPKRDCQVSMFDMLD